MFFLKNVLLLQLFCKVLNSFAMNVKLKDNLEVLVVNRFFSQSFFNNFKGQIVGPCT